MLVSSFSQLIFFSDLILHIICYHDNFKIIGKIYCIDLIYKPIKIFHQHFKLTEFLELIQLTANE